MVRVQAMRRRELRRFTRFGGAARDVMLRAPLSTVRWSVNTRTRLQQAGDISHFFRYLVDWMPLPIWVGSKQLKRALGSLEESSGESPLSTPVWFAPAVAMLRDSTISLALSPHLHTGWPMAKNKAVVVGKKEKFKQLFRSLGDQTHHSVLIHRGSGAQHLFRIDDRQPR